jgi:DNA replication and repair protein RecF
MFIKSLRLDNFRNYERVEIDFHKKTNILIGNNGQGKTNLMEGIYVLSLGKSFRTTKDAEMIRFEAEFMKSEGVFEKEGEALLLEVKLNRKEGSRHAVSKSFGVNGVKGTRNADLLENAYIVVFSPEDLRIVKDEPEKRRKFMDRELFLIKPLYYKALARYKKALQQRNALLKNGNVEENSIAAWDESLVYYGMRIMKERRFFIERVSGLSRNIHEKITGGRETLEIEYEANIPLYKEEEQQKCAFEKEMQKNREKDIKIMNTTAGPHRDDIRINIGGVDVRRFGSQGQQRTAALSLKLAELAVIKEETGEDAVILLDDVLSELDEGRQQFLINFLEGNQLFISAAEMSREKKDAFGIGKIFYVEKGEISENDS